MRLAAAGAARVLPRTTGWRHDNMARPLSALELALGIAGIALVAFVGSQVVASPASPFAGRPAGLSGLDSATIDVQYRSHVATRARSYAVPEWLARLHIARLQAAAERVVADTGAPPSRAESPGAGVAEATGSYLVPMLAEDGNVASRWRASVEPIGVWVQPSSPEPGFTPDLVGPTRRAFTVWNELGLGVAFAPVEDSTAADVHVTWSATMASNTQVGTTFRMSGADGWITFAHVILSTARDIYTVQNAARHEAGHVLGLGHSPNAADIMAATSQGRQYQLTAADRLTASLLYRLPAGEVGAAR
jgi:hypothetical protein